jgi:hypothetical protein
VKEGRRSANFSRALKWLLKSFLGLTLMENTFTIPSEIQPRQLSVCMYMCRLPLSVSLPITREVENVNASFLSEFAI